MIGCMIDLLLQTCNQHTDWTLIHHGFFMADLPGPRKNKKKMAVEQKCSYRSLIQIERQLANWIWHNFFTCCSKKQDRLRAAVSTPLHSLFGAYIGLSHHCRYSALNTVRWEQRRPRLEDRFKVSSFHLYHRIFEI